MFSLRNGRSIISRDYYIHVECVRSSLWAGIICSDKHFAMMQKKKKKKSNRKTCIQNLKVFAPLKEEKAELAFNDCLKQSLFSLDALLQSYCLHLCVDFLEEGPKRVIP